MIFSIEPRLYFKAQKWRDDSTVQRDLEELIQTEGHVIRTWTSG